MKAVVLQPSASLLLCQHSSKDGNAALPSGAGCGITLAMDKSLVKHSKFLSLVLRHKPEEIGLVLEEGGWVRVDTLLAALKSHGKGVITRAVLDEVVATNEKKRFAFSEDGRKIRANQGHSVEIDLKLEAKAPPEMLYHGTVQKFLRPISNEGLVKGSRHAVHLSGDLDTAITVGKRRGEPVILGVRAGDMARAGHVFYQSANGVWLTDHVPPQYLDYSLIG
jgi:putative RNA 2'-phosphotransferase